MDIKSQLLKNMITSGDVLNVLAKPRTPKALLNRYMFDNLLKRLEGSQVCEPLRKGNFIIGSDV